MGNEMSGGSAPNRSWGQSGAPPPVSSKHLAKYLTPISVTADDLLEETNKECAICLGDQLIGDPASKLPCGHLFHVECVEQWLRLHCTCPVCRFELETDDSCYELDRRGRMKDRKLRYRRDELDKKSISALKEIMGQFKLDSVNCYDKRDLVDKLIASGHIELVEGTPRLEMTEEEISKKSVRQLREIMLSFGISMEGAIEKSDLIHRLLDSGRINIIIKCDSNVISQQEKAGIAEDHFKTDPSHVILSEKEVENVLQGTNTTNLKKLLENNNVSTNGALERADLIDRFMASGLPFRGNIIDDTTSSTMAGQVSADMDVEYDLASLRCGHTKAVASAAESIYYSSSEKCMTILSVKELKSICAALEVDLTGCLDKIDIVNRLKASGHSI